MPRLPKVIIGSNALNPIHNAEKKSGTTKRANVVSKYQKEIL